MNKENRLKKNHDFQQIIFKKQSYISRDLVLYYLPNSQNKLRVGISVSKKFANAVGRNKLRRQVRNILDNIKPYNKSYDVVLILRKPFINLSFGQKTNSLNKIFQKI